MTESQARRFYPAALAALSLILFLPGLNSFGFWDPYEIRIADSARMLSQQPSWTLQPQLGKPPALILLVAWGFKNIGITELGGRLPIALLAFATVMATWYAGAGLIRRRGALMGAAALATCPAFLLGARQLTSQVPILLGAALALGGLGRAAWPRPDTSTGRRVLDLLLGVVGLVIAYSAGGVLLGVLPSLSAIAIAGAMAGGAAGVVGVASAASAIAVAAIVFSWKKSMYSPILGGVPHALGQAGVVTQHLKTLGFALFPWIAMSPLGALRAIETASADVDGDPERSRVRFGCTLLVTSFVTTYVAGTIQSAGVSDLPVPLAPIVLLLVGHFLDEVLDGVEPLPFAGLTVALGAIILGRDFFMAPETYVSAHLSESIRWPGPLTHVPYVVMAYAAFFGGVVGLGLGVRLAAKDASEAQLRRGRHLLVGAGGLAALLMALATNFWIVPQVSKHLSVRDVYGKTRMLDPKAPIGQYRFNASGSAYYAGGKAATTLGTLPDLFGFLGKPERVFVLAGAEELPAIDQLARQDRKPYYVVDDSNSRFLVLSNQLGGNEQDLNPLKRFISDQPPKPKYPVEVNFEDKVQLLGYDLPDTLSRGQDFKIRLYFKVLQPLGGSYKVFIHFDGPGTRFNGDHIPLEGRFPTQHWVPGYFITDEHAMTPDRATQPSGYYRVFMGFFAGDKRLKVTSGPQDGENRVKLGAITIK